MKKLLIISPCKEIQYRLRFWNSKLWIPDCGYWILVFVSTTWILDYNLQWDPESPELFSGFHKQCFPHSASRIPKGIIFLIPEAGFPYMGLLLARIIRGLSMLIRSRCFKSKCLIFNAEIHYQIMCSTSECHLGLFRTTTACLTQRQLHRHDNVTTVYEPTICTEKSQSNLFNTDIKGIEPTSVRFTEVSVL